MKKPNQDRPISRAELLLYNEAAIKKAVKEKREEFTYIRTSRIDGSGGGKGKGTTDTTGRTAINKMKEIKFVTVDGIGTVPLPEKWLQVFERVRGYARQCENPDIILDLWNRRYRDGEEIDETLLPADDMIVSIFRWIRVNVKVEARKEGLIL